MKRRGFLGMLFGAPAAVVAGKAAAEFPKELIESEPEPQEASAALNGWDDDDDMMCSAVAYPYAATCIVPVYPPKRR